MTLPAASIVHCRRAYPADAVDGAAIVDLLHAYALDPMGGAQGLADAVRATLAQELARRPTVHCWLAFIDDAPAGVAVCIEGFSTFACRPLLNLHDIAVLPQARRRGVARALLAAVEREALAMGCCKLTLEVLSNNRAAQDLYRSAGFSHYQLDPAAGQALFWQKLLPPAFPPTDSKHTSHD